MSSHLVRVKLSRVAVSSLIAVAACGLAAGPAEAATQQQFASGWSVRTGPNWTPAPPSTNPLGAPEGLGSSLCTGGINPTSGEYAEFTFSGFAGIADPITGIEVRVKYRGFGLDARLTQGGAVLGSTLAVPGYLDQPANCDNTTWQSAGGPGELWAAGLTAADFNANSVGFRVTLTGNTADIDAVELVVHFGNEPPSAEANGPYAVNEGGSVGLSSAGSSDPDGDPLTFEWDLDDNGSFETPGASPAFSAVGRDGPSAQTVVLRVTDPGMLSDTDSATVQIANVAPSVAPPVVAPEPSDEGDAVTASAAFVDPAGLLDAPYTCTVDYGDGSGAQAGTVAGSTCTGPSHVYGDDGSYPVTVAVTDNDGGTGSNTANHQVDNVPPTVAVPTVSPSPSDEGEAVTASATFSDPGTDDSPFTCTVDYGPGPVAGSVAGTTCTGPAHTYGDDGVFPVTVEVTDKDGGSGSETGDHPVDNLAPSATLDTAGAIPFPGCEAFIGTAGVEQSHDASADDPGSDDLTFDWTFPPSASSSSATYFNNAPANTPDPAASPDGIFPFAASDTAAVTFSEPGLYTVRVEVTDDDGGTDADELAKIVTGSAECTRSQGFWRKQFSPKGHHHVDAATLSAFLDLIDCASGVFSELVPAFDLVTARDVFAPGGSKFDKAARQLLAAWLNFAAGSVAWDDGIDLDGDALPDATVAELITAAELILLDPGASHADLVLAKDLAEAINLRDQGNPVCSD